MSTAKSWVVAMAAVVVAGAVVAAIMIGGWKLHWWAAKAAQNNQYQVNTSSQQYQSGLVSQERDRVQGWLNATDATQKSLIGSMFCATYLDLTQVPADLSQAAAEIHCAN